MYTHINFIKNDSIIFEKNALEQLDDFLKIQNTIEQLHKNDTEFFGNSVPEILNVSITPDFHKGTIIPIGTVIQTKDFIIPQAIGNDINCGMRLYTTNLSSEKLENKLNIIEQKIRQIFFEGKREIPMNKIQREAMFREGLLGILETHSLSKNIGIWKYYNAKKQEQELDNISENGSYKADSLIGFDDFLGHDELSYDTQIGSIGGGNHFVEIQKVSKIFDSKTANVFGLKMNQIVVMIHTGSLMIGHASGSQILNIIKNIYPKHIKNPDNNIFILPTSEKYQYECKRFWNSMNNAANFAFTNRLFLGLMIERIFSEIFGQVEFNLLYDAPHNLVWKQDQHTFLHRKGACPARSMEQLSNTKFSYYGEPVLIPGSMGSSSYIMRGLGNEKSLSSASHGAGRKLSRGKALKQDHKKFIEFVNNFKVITPLDIKRHDIAGRTDILKKWEENIKSEAPYAYKDINDIIEAQVEQNIVDKIAEVKPFLTIKN